MRPQLSELCGLRIGCVRYLNAKPLIAAFDGTVTFDHPARLADMLNAGTLDVALVPTFEALRCPDFPIADGVSISSDGPVYSVFLAYRGRLEHVKKIVLDPASRTSANLLRCILAEFHGLEPEYLPGAGIGDGGEARLLIGNQAIEFRQSFGGDFSYLDLGEEWKRRTGLPFVFAVWLLRPEVLAPAAVGSALRELKERGLTRIAQIVERQSDFRPEFARRYLTEFIRFDLGSEERAGIERFRVLLRKHGLLSKRDGALRYV